MTGLLRFDGALPHHPAVDEWLQARPGALGELARAWFARMRRCGPDVRELVHDGCPVACVEDAPFGYVNVFRAHVNVGFFHGASVHDPAGLLRGQGRFMRHVRLEPGLAMATEALEALVVAAYQDIRRRLGVAP